MVDVSATVEGLSAIHVVPVVAAVCLRVWSGRGPVGCRLGLHDYPRMATNGRRVRGRPCRECGHLPDG